MSQTGCTLEGVSVSVQPHSVLPVNPPGSERSRSQQINTPNIGFPPNCYPHRYRDRYRAVSISFAAAAIEVSPTGCALSVSAPWCAIGVDVDVEVRSATLYTVGTHAVSS